MEVGKTFLGVAAIVTACALFGKCDEEAEAEGCAAELQRDLGATVGHLTDNIGDIINNTLHICGDGTLKAHRDGEKICICSFDSGNVIVDYGVDCTEANPALQDERQEQNRLDGIPN